MEPAFEENFELVLVTGYDGAMVHPSSDEFRAEFLERVRADIQRETESDDVELRPVGYGYGADTIALAVLLSSLSTLLLAGKSINENLEAWLALGRRVQSLIRTLSQSVVPPRISEPAAFALALTTIASKEPDMPPVALLSKAITRVPNGSLTPQAHDRFRDHPDRYYIFTVQVGERRTHIVGMSSHGAVLFHHTLPLNRESFFQSKP